MAEPIDLADARNRVRQRARQNGTEIRSLRDAMGCVLAQSLVGDTDSPPFDKSLVDGFAIATTGLADQAAAHPQLRIVDAVMAGEVPRQSVGVGQAMRIMTGAPLPAGADAVVMLEEVQVDGSMLQLPKRSLPPGQHVMRRGTAYRAGQPTVSAGQRLRPIEIGVLAETGRAQVTIVRPARVALVQTGDELVAPEQSPGPGQIRNSNGPLLEALVSRYSGLPTNLGIIPDEIDSLTAAIREGLEHDVLIVSGGVSAGDRDLVPDAFQRVGIHRVFHKVALRPGKPLWFGEYDADKSRPSTLVFGLPGNPVSGLVGFLLFIAPTLVTIGGGTHDWHESPATGRLIEPFELRGGRPTFWPAQFSQQGDITPLAWSGSADPFTLVHANCLIYLPIGNRTYEAGESLAMVALD